MKALSVLEPWASLIMHGKSVENRSWYMAYRGPLVICASKRIDTQWTQEEWGHLLWWLGPHKPPTLPDLFSDFPMLHGYALGLVDVIGCDHHMTNNPWEVADQLHIRLANPRPFSKPFPQKGQLGLYEIDDEIVRSAA